MVTQIYNPQTWEVKAGRLGIQGQPQLPEDFEASLGFCFKGTLATHKKKKKGEKEWEEEGGQH